MVTPPWPVQPPPVLTLEARGPPRSPQLLHRDEGFSTSGERGGWFLLWAEQTSANRGETKLARMVGSQREALNVETLAVGPPGYPMLLPKGAASVNTARLVTDDGGRARVESFSNWCDVTD
jgi:hypothetical protein